MTAAFADLDSMVVAEEVVDPVAKARDEWMEQRHGKITASNFGLLVGEGRGKDRQFTKTGYDYLHTVIAERLGSFKFGFETRATDWGTEQESNAIECYEQCTGHSVDSGLFRFHQLTDDIGGTPDGLVGKDGCIEVKCPYNPGVHVNTTISGEVPPEYLWQCVGHLLVTGRKWCDFVSYDPRMDGDARMQVIRIGPDFVSERIVFLRERLDLAVRYVKDRFMELVP